MNIDWLLWGPAVAVGLHIFEEFAWPGGFLPWYRHYRGTSSVTARFLWIINTLLVLVCWNAASLGDTPIGAAYRLTLSALLCSNGCWHAWVGLKTRTYSPGVVTGVLLYVPLAVYEYYSALGSHKASVGTAVVASIIGGSYHFWSAAFHRKRRQKV